MDEAEHKVRSRKGKTRESAVKAARLRVLQEYGITKAQATRRFADPAQMI